MECNSKGNVANANERHLLCVVGHPDAVCVTGSLDKRGHIVGGVQDLKSVVPNNSNENQRRGQVNAEGFEVIEGSGFFHIQAR